MLEASVEREIGRMRAVPLEEYALPMETPWPPQDVVDVMGCSQWNMAYHEGQIRYIASLPAVAESDPA